MRSNNVLLVIALIAVSFSNANAFEFTNLAEVKELRASSYGNSLIETISLSLQNRGSLDEVQKLLNDLLFKLNKDQEEADSAWEKTNAELLAHIDDLTKKIDETNNQILLDEAEKKDYEGKRDQAAKNLEQYRAQFNANKLALERNEENRKKDEAEYKHAVQDHNDVINAIEAVVAELRKLEGSVSGNAKPVHVEEIDNERRDRERAEKLQNSFVQLTRDETEAMIFAQMATTADQEALAKLIGLLNNLLESTKKSLNDDQEHEERSIAAYLSLKATLTEDNLALEKSIDEQTKNFNDYVDNVNRLTVKIDKQKEYVVSLEAEKAATIKEREDKERQYQSDKAERDNERKVIQRLQKIFQEKLANMSKFLRSQTGGF